MAEVDWRPLASLLDEAEFPSDILLWNPCDGVHHLWTSGKPVVFIVMDNTSCTHWSPAPTGPDGAARPILRCMTCNSPRVKAPCHKCGGELHAIAAGWEDPVLPPVDEIRALAMQVGYAIGLHGSLERDLDLIAVPWTDEAISAQALADHIAAGLGGRVIDPGPKPLGRWACNIQMDGWYKLIDLSVAPREREPQNAA